MKICQSFLNKLYFLFFLKTVKANSSEKNECARADKTQGVVLSEGYCGGKEKYADNSDNTVEIVER